MEQGMSRKERGPKTLLKQKCSHFKLLVTVSEVYFWYSLTQKDFTENLRIQIRNVVLGEVPAEIVGYSVLYPWEVSC